MDRSTFESADPILDEMGRYGQFHLVYQLLEQAAILLSLS